MSVLAIQFVLLVGQLVLLRFTWKDMRRAEDAARRAEDAATTARAVANQQAFDRLGVTR